MCLLYYYKDEWHVGSTGYPDAIGMFPCGLRFCALFWEIWESLKYKLPTDTTKCYIFEMLTDKNRIIVPQKRETLVLICVRDMTNLQELPIEEIAIINGWECVKSFSNKIC